jgi:MFS-type transporter involved in bile tolerance (Atg22 family)
VVKLAGLVQGIVLVTVPAASTKFTSRRFYGLSDLQYGAIFVSMVVLVIVTSLLGAGLAERITTKGVYLAGLVAMGLLLLSGLFESDHAVAYPLLLAGTAFAGAGPGWPSRCSTPTPRRATRTAPTRRYWC